MSRPFFRATDRGQEAGIMNYEGGRMKAGEKGKSKSGKGKAEWANGRRGETFTNPQSRTL